MPFTDVFMTQVLTFSGEQEQSGAPGCVTSCACAWAARVPSEDRLAEAHGRTPLPRASPPSREKA